MVSAKVGWHGGNAMRLAIVVTNFAIWLVYWGIHARWIGPTGELTAPTPWNLYAFLAVASFAAGMGLVLCWPRASSRPLSPEHAFV